MPSFAVTDVPQRLFHSSQGDKGNPNQLAMQVAPTTTGTVYIAKNQAECVAGQTNYITENTAAFSVDLTAGQEAWVVCGSGLTATVDYNTFGPGAMPAPGAGQGV